MQLHKTVRPKECPASQLPASLQLPKCHLQQLVTGWLAANTNMPKSVAPSEMGSCLSRVFASMRVH